MQNKEFSCFSKQFKLIQVWDAGRKVPRLIQEVREHNKAVTCLCLSSSSDKLYSGSLDKTIRVSNIMSFFTSFYQKHNGVSSFFALTGLGNQTGRNSLHSSP